MIEVNKNSDWRKPEEYEYTNFHDDELWAWEFLRRNDNYINVWDKCCRWVNATDEDLNNPKFRICLAKKHEKWGLKEGLLNPSIANPYYLNFTNKRARLKVKLRCKDADKTNAAVTVKDIEKNVTDQLGNRIYFAKTIFNPERHNFPIEFLYGENDMVAFFDLEKPIPRQIKIVSEILTKLQEQKIAKGVFEISKTKRHKDKWIEYLRTLDAYRDGFKPGEIANFLYPNEINCKDNEYKTSHWVTNNYKQAYQLVHGGYLKLLT
jgi:hypothetical protein